MFEGCTSLKSIRTAQTDWNSNQYCYNWLNNASSTGVFECPSALDMTTRDASHVPAGWIVKYTDDPQADWDESDSLVSTYIKNKPVIPEPTEQVQADWDESDSTAVDYIKNKPAISGGSDDADYLCFELARDPENKGVKLRLDKNGSPSEISLEYSMDRQTWTTYTWSGTTGYEITLSGAGSKAWFRSESTNSSFSSGSYNYYKFIGENVAIGFGVGRFYVSGNIMSLVDKTCQSTVIPNNYCFTSLFSGNISILTAPKLPATTLKDSCYFNLFANQSRLVKAPELPATTIAQGCYGRMFFNCTSLTEVPELPATTLAQGCYNEMFSGCSDLTETPDEMPVTTLADTCYASMFRNCTSLKKAPKLPATTLTSSCYNGMFYGCSSLTEAPDLPATAMSNSCYNGMFYGCTSLYYVKLAATSTATSATQYMFSNITTNGMLEAPDALDVTGFMPATWVKVPASSSPDGSTTSVAEASSASIYGITPGQSETGVLAVASSLTLNAIGTTSMDIAYAEVVIDLAVGATVTAGTGLTLVDTPTDGKRNVCVVRWQGGTARLYVVDVMDIPA